MLVLLFFGAIALNKKEKSIYLAGGNAPTFKSPKVLQINLMYHIAFVRVLEYTK